MPYVRAESLVNSGEGTRTDGVASRFGAQVVVDFYTYMALMGKAFQVRAGTLSVPIVGDVLITDQAAEMAVSCPSGLTIIPTSANISFNLAAATLFESAGKSVASATISGTAFVPLPLRTGSRLGASAAASSCSAACATAGGVGVAAELATTTRRHFSWSQPIAAGAWETWYDWDPKVPPVLVGPSCFYIQIAADTTAPSYFASFDYIEDETVDLI